MLISSGCHRPFQDEHEVKDLSGIWKFQLDPDNAGMGESWYNKQFPDSIPLPGTTDEYQKGIYKNEQEVERLSRLWYWEGAAWYQKEVDIPEDWTGKNVKLLLERTKDTYVWFDGINCGYENTLSAPQYFDLTKAAKPGKHLITVLVDNAKLPPVGNSFAISEKTQTNWNGIIGRTELHVTDPVWIDEVQVYPEIKSNSIKIRLTFGNITGSEAEGKLHFRAESWNTEKTVKFKIRKQRIKEIKNNEVLEYIYHFDKKAPLWDEFDPALIRLNINLSVNSDGVVSNNSKQIDFGMREFQQKGRHLYINGKRVFLRGRIDCANYPLTGYPPMRKEEWIELFRELKSYGINHWRFHSWFPPEAALLAADEEGVYLQPELPNQSYDMDNKNSYDETFQKMYIVDTTGVESARVNMTLKEYLRREGELIFRYYGNHPSFTMFTLGNELGRNKAMSDLVEHFKGMDPRRLYAQGSNNMALNPSMAKGDDFWVTARASGKYGVRGSFAVHLCPEILPHIEYTPPSSLHTYSQALENVDAPAISHEIGQFQVSPDFNDIPKFTGVTRARNYEIFRERLKEAKMLDQADDFVQASGKLAVICYREDIEAALRTPDLAGFQLLDIQDFPGQGTALVGILNDFMEPKGFITPEKWSQFCSEVVPLLKMRKYTWTNDEEFKADVAIAHYGKEDFNDAELSWKLVNGKGESLGEGEFRHMDIEQGAVAEIGEISIALNSIETAEKLNMIISLEGTRYKNEYDIWVYPKSVNTIIPEGIVVTDKLDLKTRKHLQNGGKAIIIPDHNKITHCIRGAFQTDFWCYPMFARGAIRRGMEPAPGSLGFICDPDSPLLADFPTEFHSNWQWWQLVKNCKPIILDDTPADYKPLIQTIDNFTRNHKLGMIFETRYGEGSALICAIDLLNLQDKPEARQLYYSILNYVKSDRFSPDKELGEDVLSEIIP
ncbi:MAG: beta-galactosidase [Bacteroidetes bacterium]|nr:beta-galactosidase [Bacteroidota bacterium]